MSDNMPFDTYLRDPYDDGSNGGGSSNASSGSNHAQSSSALNYTEDQATMLGLDSSTFCNSIQFQMPAFMMSGGPPLLAPGGGAEVLPAMFSPQGVYSGSSSWLKNFGLNQSDEQSKFFTMEEEDEHLETASSSLPFHFPDTVSNHQNASLPPTGTNIAPETLTSDTTLIPAIPQATVFAPSAHGLPVYSASGFDMLSILSHVATRPHPKIVLGPVDFTCSFVVVDVRRYDHPIVYASPSFCTLTGYSESEVLGRNCRFLQAPDGRVERNETRRYTAPEAVIHLKRSLSVDKECQVSMINYRKGGAAFINLLSVIPVPGGAADYQEQSDDIAYHVGFQVDLTEQPNAILQKLRDGSYIVNYSSAMSLSLSSALNARERNSMAMSKDLRMLVANPSFQRSLRISTSTTAANTSGSASAAVEKSDLSDEHQTLNLALLEHGPDFVHVLSLKGYFLYVSPSVRTILGYEPDELVGKSITEYCHPSDVVPLIRELKESSTTPANAAPPTANDTLGQFVGSLAPVQPKIVDLLFRALTKSGEYVWIESLGRLHVEPGKGRKAVVLSGRVRSMPRLGWDAVACAGGLAPPLPSSPSSAPHGSQRSVASGEDEPEVKEREFWGMLSREGTFLVAGAAVRDVLGWGSGEMIGRSVGEFVVSTTATAEGGSPRGVDCLRMLKEALLHVSDDARETLKVPCEMKQRDGELVSVHIVLYRSRDGGHGARMSSMIPSLPLPRCPMPPIVCQIQLAPQHFSHSSPASPMSISPTEASYPGRIMHSHTANVFEELETARKTSWQYELQQLKFANRRLLEEVETLEASVHSSRPAHPQQQTTVKSQRMSPTLSHLPALLPLTTSQYPSSSAQQQQHAQMQASAGRSQQIHYPTHVYGQQQHTHADTVSHYQNSPSSLGKRPWDNRSEGGST